VGVWAGGAVQVDTVHWLAVTTALDYHNSTLASTGPTADGLFVVGEWGCFGVLVYLCVVGCVPYLLFGANALKPACVAKTWQTLSMVLCVDEL
jgi:hypothetical protein